ncbi:hypothetical protein CO110_09810, partial [Candidatus Desantisbacteria bacterium CG_4_9_14_3_um_filter_40_11]
IFFYLFSMAYNALFCNTSKNRAKSFRTVLVLSPFSTSKRRQENKPNRLTGLNQHQEDFSDEDWLNY